jgi:hypothetical protein
MGVKFVNEAFNHVACCMLRRKIAIASSLHQTRTNNGCVWRAQTDKSLSRTCLPYQAFLMLHVLIKFAYKGESASKNKGEENSCFKFALHTFWLAKDQRCQLLPMSTAFASSASKVHSKRTN